MKSERWVLLENTKQQKGKVNQERGIQKRERVRIGKDKEKHHSGDGRRDGQCMWTDRSQV